MSFRPLVRIKQALSQDECIAILKDEPRGVLSVLGDDDYPYGMPMDHYYDEEDGCLYFHSGMMGHKVDAMKRHDKVSYCVYDKGFLKEGDWALNIKSVIVFGRVEFVQDEQTVYDIARKLSHKFTDDERYIEDEIARSGRRTLLFRIRPEHVSGKIVNEK